MSETAFPLAGFRRALPASRGPRGTADGELAFLDTAGLLRGGYLAVAILAVFLGGWAGFAPLDSAIVAPGVVVVESHHKAIQHLEGGIVSAVLVSDGQHVKAGQPLIRLNQTQAHSSFATLSEQADALAAQEARLVAERDDRETIEFPPGLRARAAQPGVAQAMAGETSAFNSHRDTLNKQVEILQSRIAQDQRIIAGLQAQQDSLEAQIGLMDREIVPVQKLFDQQMDTLQHVLSLKRQKSIMEGTRGEIIAKIAQTRLNIDENRMQIQNLRNERQNTVMDQLRAIQVRRLEIANKLRTAGDIYDRVTVKAPAAGRVVALSVHSRGTVVKPGQTLMEIVPDDDELEVEARLAPQDADSAYVGMDATVRLTGYKQRLLPVIQGRVTEVSADRLVDSRTGQPYFSVLVRVSRAPLKDYVGLRLMPGIPVEVALKTGSRTVLQYLAEPVTDIMQRGMREK
ncbi:MAG TPA: HlyD family type I secretion periplasmic adaptor subunit [Rhizomicrobium sp.]|jgi:HlyD family secretion protein/epimerase transport system membrane fusion protein|nr:HlyD family type I secretion periplasmic adaptor subunit [Rhizomicrobium sp.]